MTWLKTRLLLVLEWLSIRIQLSKIYHLDICLNQFLIYCDASIALICFCYGKKECIPFFFNGITKVVFYLELKALKVFIKVDKVKTNRSYLESLVRRYFKLG